jgi:hypothetical protein
MKIHDSWFSVVYGVAFFKGRKPGAKSIGFPITRSPLQFV